MKKIILLSMISILFSCQPKEVETTKSKKEEVEIPVTLAKVQAYNQPIVISTTGLVQSNSTTKYAFKIGGVVESVYVDEGAFVKKGQLLATLRMDEIEAQYQQAQLGVEKAKRDLQRIEYLYNDSIATLEDFQNVQTQLDIAEKTVDQITFNKKYAKIYATSSGAVTTKLSNPGEVVGPGSPIFIVNDARGNKGYILECTVNDRQWTQIKKGDRCQVVLDAYPEQPISGIVDNKSVQADPVSGAFRIEIKLNAVDQALATGMYGSVKMITQQLRTAVSIPYQALVQANGNTGFVFTLNESREVQRSPVKIERLMADSVLIAEGLSAGQSILIGNNAFLTEGSPIKIID